MEANMKLHNPKTKIRGRLLLLAAAIAVSFSMCAKADEFQGESAQGEQGATIEQTLEQGYTPEAWNIIAPVLYDTEEEITDFRALLEHLSAKGVNSHDKQLNTPLIIASRLGDTERIKELIAQGADVNAANKKGMTPLMNAAFFAENDECATMLLNAGAEVNAADKSGWTPIMYALLGDRSLEFIRDLIDNRNAYPEQRTKAKVSPMMIACQFSKHAELPEILYAANCEVNVPDDKGNLPLHYAAQNTTAAAAEMIRALDRLNVKVDVQNGGGWTPLMLACQFSNNPEVIKVLLGMDAQPNMHKNDGMTPLMLAACNSSGQAIEIMKLLLKAGADTQIRSGGRSLREVALRSAYSVDVVKFIDQLPPSLGLKTYELTSELAPYTRNVTNIAQTAGPERRSRVIGPAPEQEPELTKEQIEERLNQLIAGKNARAAQLEAELSDASSETGAGEVTAEGTALSIQSESAEPQAAEDSTSIVADVTAETQIVDSTAVQTAQEIQDDTTDEKEQLKSELKSAAKSAREKGKVQTSEKHRVEKAFRQYLAKRRAKKRGEDISNSVVYIEGSEEETQTALSQEQTAEGAPTAETSGGLVIESAAAADADTITADQIPEIEAVETAPSAQLQDAATQEDGQDLSASEENTQEAEVKAMDAHLQEGEQAEDDGTEVGAEGEEVAEGEEQPTEEELLYLQLVELLSPEKYVSDEDIAAAKETQSGNENASAAAKAVEDSLQYLNQIYLYSHENLANKAQETSKIDEKNKPAPKTKSKALQTVFGSADLISTPQMQASYIYGSEELRRGKKVHEVTKLHPFMKKDKLFVTPLMLAAVNETDGSPEIIKYLLECGEDIEAKDGEGRTPLACAVRYNPNPIAAQTLIELGASTKVKVNGNPLAKLARFNKKIKKEDRNALIQLIRDKNKAL